jgi:2-oxoglutarate ferredoxin oxidoreductase subunit beta
MPFGNIEALVNPISLPLGAGATFVARGFSAEQKHLTELIKQGIRHQGFSFLNAFSPCVTYDRDDTYQWVLPSREKARRRSSLRLNGLDGRDRQVSALG